MIPHFTYTPPEHTHKSHKRKCLLVSEQVQAPSAQTVWSRTVTCWWFRTWEWEAKTMSSASARPAKCLNSATERIARTITWRG